MLVCEDIHPKINLLSGRPTLDFWPVHRMLVSSQKWGQGNQGYYYGDGIQM